MIPAMSPHARFYRFYAGVFERTLMRRKKIMFCDHVAPRLNIAVQAEGERHHDKQRIRNGKPQTQLVVMSASVSRRECTPVGPTP